MAYTALAQMREKNKALYGTDIGPVEPVLYVSEDNKNDLKSAALRFLHNDCEGLRFDAGKEAQEKETGNYLGTSIKPEQIPYNMQMDINRRCLEVCLEQFIDSGAAEDAYLVYYCFLEIFVGHYGKSKKMIELLSEYESNGSSLLMKHRDHYSHSVYVFALGLAIYETNVNYRRKFRDFYMDRVQGVDLRDHAQAANLFLEYWGYTALFHDIGYPFELPFEQQLSYFEVNNQERGKGNPFIVYQGIDTLIGLVPEETDSLEKLYGRRFKSTDELFSHAITEMLGKDYDFDEEYLTDVIRNKPVSPGRFGYYMDHAYFSANRLYRELVNSLGAGGVNRMHVDALTAILLHNSLYKFSVAFYKDKNHKAPLDAKLHPLAWLLMLCDELQCWDRTAYGRNSRSELHPMAAEFDFSDNALKAVYYYDRDEQDKIKLFKVKYTLWEINGEKDEPPRLKAYSDMAEKEQRFTKDIQKIVNTSDIPLTVIPDMRNVNRKNKHTFLSSSNFMHLYDFAVSVHGRKRDPEVTTKELEKTFEALSLEYQLSTIGRAKNFSRYLDAIHCFYTDKPVDYEMVREFTPEQAAVFAPLEHERWIRDHQHMGWRYGDLYETAPLPEELRETDEPEPQEKKDRRNALIQMRREQMRCHKLTMDGDPSAEEIKAHYLQLSEEDQDKDWRPFNSMLNLLKRFDGLRIYKLDDDI